MIFCKKCGTQLEDGVTICPNCGTNQSEPIARPASQSAPDFAKAITVPSIKGWIAFGATVLTFILSLVLSWFKVVVKYPKEFSELGAESVSKRYNILSSEAFEVVGGVLVVAKVFMIISIVLFVAYVLTTFINVNKLAKLPVDVKKVTGLAYFASLAIALFFDFIGILANSFNELMRELFGKNVMSINITVGFFFILIVAAIAFILNYTKLASKYIPALK